MPSANEILQSLAIHRQVDLQHFSNGEVRKIIALLNRADVQLAERLAAAVDRLGDESFTAKHLDAVLSAVRELNRQVYAQATEALTADLDGLVQSELTAQAKSMSAVLPAAVIDRFPLVALDYAQVRTIAFSRPFQGRLLREWMSGLEEGRAARVRDTIRIGMVSGETTAQIVQRIRGTRAEGYKDGILDRSRRDIEAVVRTAIGHVSSVSRDSFYAANDHLIKAMRWVSTLDGRTSEPCRLRDGLEFAPGSYKPLGHKVPWGAGPGRLHFCCRSTSVPVLKSWKELGIELNELEPTERASMNGQVPAGTTYAAWLKEQSPTRQDQILGKSKAAMFRTGNLPLDRFYNDKGMALTVEQLAAKEPAAYVRAGLANPIQAPRGEHKDEIAIFLASKAAQADLLSSLYDLEGIDLARSMRHVAAAKTEQGYRATVESLAAVRWYTGSGYAAMNKRLREQHGLLRDRQYQALTARGVEGMHQFDGPVFRSPTRRIEMADNWWERAVPGQSLEMGTQFQSFSASSEFATGWSGESDLLLRIASPRKGAYIEPVTFHDGEHEVLFPPGLKYRVTAKAFESIDGKRYRVIDLEIIDE